MKQNILDFYKKIKTFATSSAKSRPCQTYVPNFLRGLDVLETMLTIPQNYALTKVADADLVNEVVRRLEESNLHNTMHILLAMLRKLDESYIQGLLEVAKKEKNAMIDLQVQKVRERLG